jgi:hypothetical protein
MTFQREKIDVSNLPALAKIDGGIAAAFISSGAGCFGIGLMTVLAEADEKVANLLNWWSPVGPLSGKTGVGLIAWLASWLMLHFALKENETNLKSVLATSLTLIGLGFLLTFPPVFGAIAG